MLSKLICWPLGIGTPGLLHSKTRKFRLRSKNPSISLTFIPPGKQLSNIPQSQIPSINFSGFIIVMVSVPFAMDRKRSENEKKSPPPNPLVNPKGLRNGLFGLYCLNINFFLHLEQNTSISPLNAPMKNNRLQEQRNSFILILRLLTKVKTDRTVPYLFIQTFYNHRTMESYVLSIKIKTFYYNIQNGTTYRFSVILH